MKKVIRKVGLIIITSVSLLLIFAVIKLLWYFLSHDLHLDFSQNYRKIDGYEDIVLANVDDSYRRTFWGLSRIDREIPQLEKAQNGSDEIYEKLISLVGDDYYIDQYVLSPDGNRILFEEMHPWGEGAPTDSDDVYFKVVDINDGSIVTLFKGPQQYFDIYWE